MKVSDILRVKGGTLFTVTPDEPMSRAVEAMAGVVYLPVYAELPDPALRDLAGLVNASVTSARR